jgi:hypothetical protein
MACEQIGRPRFTVGFKEPSVRPSQIAGWLSSMGVVPERRKISNYRNLLEIIALLGVRYRGKTP